MFPMLAKATSIMSYLLHTSAMVVRICDVKVKWWVGIIPSGDNVALIP